MVRFFYFDLGNVLVNFSHERGCRQLANLLQTNPEMIRKEIFDSDVQIQFESGLISNSDFCSYLNQRFEKDLDETQILEAASDIFWLNKEVFPVIEALTSQRLPLGILSNTCQAHWDFVSRGMLAPYLRHFDQVILSYEVQSMKPHPKIYSAAIEATGFEPPEILFVDDRLENVEGALAAGLNAHAFTSIAELKSLLNDLDLLGTGS